MKKEERDKLQALGEKYLERKARVDKHETIKKLLGKAIIKLCGPKRRTELDGITVGWDERVKRTVDAEELRQVLEPLGLWDEVTEVQVSQDRLARVLETGDLSPEAYRRVIACITEEATKYPFVRPLKVRQ